MRKPNETKMSFHAHYANVVLEISTDLLIRSFADTWFATRALAERERLAWAHAVYKAYVAFLALKLSRRYLDDECALLLPSTAVQHMWSLHMKSASLYRRQCHALTAPDCQLIEYRAPPSAGAREARYRATYDWLVHAGYSLKDARIWPPPCVRPLARGGEGKLHLTVGCSAHRRVTVPNDATVDALYQAYRKVLDYSNFMLIFNHAPLPRKCTDPISSWGITSKSPVQIVLLY